MVSTKKTDKQPEATPAAMEMAAASENEVTIGSPLSGKVVPLTAVPDEVFSSGAMGQGIAIEPTEAKVYAPFEGTVVMIAPTKHAIGLKAENGVELLIHIGLDTVTLDGSPFTVKVKDGEKFNKGDLLIEFDKDYILEKGLKTITPVIITNSFAYEQIISEDLENCTFNQKLFTVVK